MPDMDGIETTQASRARSRIAVLVLTSFADRSGSSPRSTRAPWLPAQGRVADEWSAHSRRGRWWVPAGPAGGARAARPHGARPARACRPGAGDPRLLLEGMPYKLIALRLGISERTVKAAPHARVRTIGVTDRMQAVLWAERQGLRGSFDA